MPTVCLVHLVWAPLGPSAIDRFVRAYRAHDPGIDHRLLVVFNGFAGGSIGSGTRSALADVTYEPLVLERPVQDLAAYRAAIAHAAWADRLCFANSHAEPLVDGWLAKLDAALHAERVGIVGATGSYESHFSQAARPVRPLRRRHFPPFPNAHVRTNGFMARRADLTAIDWEIGSRKRSAYRLESGKRGITRQLADRGLEPRVVDRDGRAFAPEDWPASQTFRSGDQEGLLIADNRTRQYAEGSAETRSWLRTMAWGPGASRDDAG